METIDFKEQIRKHEQARFFVLEGLRGLIELIQVTRPDIVLGIGNSKKEEKTESYGMSGYELKEWNGEWVKSAQNIIQKLWITGEIMANDVEAVLKQLTDESKSTFKTDKKVS